MTPVVAFACGFLAGLVTLAVLVAVCETVGCGRARRGGELDDELFRRIRP